MARVLLYSDVSLYNAIIHNATIYQTRQVQPGKCIIMTSIFVDSISFHVPYASLAAHGPRRATVKGTPLQSMLFTTLAGRHLPPKAPTTCISPRMPQNTGTLSQNLLRRRLWLSYQNSRSPVGRCPNNEYTILLLGLIM